MPRANRGPSSATPPKHSNAHTMPQINIRAPRASDPPELLTEFLIEFLEPGSPTHPPEARRPVYLIGFSLSFFVAEWSPVTAPSILFSGNVESMN